MAKSTAKAGGTSRIRFAREGRLGDEAAALVPVEIAAPYDAQPASG
jgi:hypothetical protein